MPRRGCRDRFMLEVYQEMIVPLPKDFHIKAYSMNTRQLLALWAGIGLMCLLLLFPPQVMMPTLPNMSAALQAQLSGTPQQMPVPVIPYAFLFAPPSGSAGIDWERLLIPVAVVALLTLGAVLTLQPPPMQSVPEG